MIHVTQGHEHGIGLEVFFKSLIYLSNDECKKITLHCSESAIKEHAAFIPYPISIETSQLSVAGNKINLSRISNDGLQSTKSLESALNIINNDDILFTLPTSKDQLSLEGKRTLGYTEYLRKKYNNDYLVMSFKSKKDNSCLLTDHIPLSMVSRTLTKKYVIKKCESIFSSFEKDKTFHFCGINPHSGENGLLGHEDEVLKETILELRKLHPGIKIGDELLPADTHHFHKNDKSVFIFTAHDQALTSFKSHNGILAANITLGLPFKRLSVDHGVAFSLYGKNKADSTGCYFCLRQCLEWEHNG